MAVATWDATEYIQPSEVKRAQHIRAAWILVVLVCSVRIAIAFNVGTVMLVPLLALTPIIIWLSPPVGAVGLLHGLNLYGQIDFQGFWLIPRIPTISVLTIWSISWLILRRYANRSLQQILQPVVLFYSGLLLAFCLLGVSVALATGNLVSSLVQIYISDIIRGWIGYFVIALLACNSLADLKVLLIGIPLSALTYPLALPAEAWQDFLGYRLGSDNLLGAGLNYGALSTNTLGQAMGLAAVLAFAVVPLVWPAYQRRALIIIAVFCVIVAFLTGSRQALLGLLAGLFVLVVQQDWRRAIIGMLVLLLSVYLGVQTALLILPVGSGLQQRFLEMIQPPDQWETGSYTTRQEDFSETIARWQEKPVFGVGFGGQAQDVLFQKEYGFELRGTHNLFLGILVQTGVAGFLLFVVFVLGLVFSFSRSIHLIERNGDRNAKSVRAAVIAGLGCILVYQNISGGMGVLSTNLIFFLGSLLGFISADFMHRKRRASKFVRRSAMYRGK